LCPFKQRVLPSVLPLSLSLSLFLFSTFKIRVKARKVSAGQSGVKKDVRIAFPRFNPQRAAGSFPSVRINKSSVSGIYGDG